MKIQYKSRKMCMCSTTTTKMCKQTREKHEAETLKWYVYDIKQLFLPIKIMYKLLRPQ